MKGLIRKRMAAPAQPVTIKFSPSLLGGAAGRGSNYFGQSGAGSFSAGRRGGGTKTARRTPRPRRPGLFRLACVLALALALLPSASRRPADAGRLEQKAVKQNLKASLAFVPNAGQTDPRVRYFAQTGGAGFYFTPGEAVFRLVKGKKGHALRLAFLGARPAPQIEGAQPAGGKVNYLIGNDQDKWHTGLPTFGQVVYRDLWPGIDLAFRGEGGALKYEFRLAPAADAGNIRLRGRRDGTEI